MELKDNILKLDKELNELDKFVIKFKKIIEKYTDYVIISGYVSILLGRARATEDIDIFIKELNRKTLNELYKELKKTNFWCLNTEDEEEIYNYLKDGLGVKFALKPLQKESFNDRILIVMGKEELKISSLERQIAFKKYYLKSDKDIEDAKHIERLFNEKIDYNKVKLYKKLIENETR